MMNMRETCIGILKFQFNFIMERSWTHRQHRRSECRHYQSKSRFRSRFIIYIGKGKWRSSEQVGGSTAGKMDPRGKGNTVEPRLTNALVGQTPLLNGLFWPWVVAEGGYYCITYMFKAQTSAVYVNLIAGWFGCISLSFYQGENVRNICHQCWHVMCHQVGARAN